MTDHTPFTAAIPGRLGLVLALTAFSQTVAVPAQLSYEVSSSPDVVVLQLSQDLGIRDADETPLVRVYGNGRVAVHFPDYMRKAGDYELELSAGAFRELVRTAADVVLPFDSTATEALVLALEEEARDDGLLFSVSDEATTILEVRVERYRPEGAAGDVREGVKRVVWTGLGSDADRFGDVVSLRDLAGVRRQLLALTDHPDLEPVTGR